MNINEPATKFFDTTLPKRYVVINKQQNLAKLTGQLEIGSYVSMSDGSTALVYTDSNDIVLDSASTSQFATNLQGLEPPPYEVFSLDTGYLTLKCSTSVGHTKGFIGWSIIKNGVLLLRGNDSIKKDFILVDRLPKASKTIWPAGLYQLSVTLYQTTMQPIRVRDIDIVLNEPKTTITQTSASNNIIELN